jgi:selenocysteine lyase/cysteine desulfurase
MSRSLTVEQITQQLYRYTYGHPQITTPFGQKYIINADVTATGYPNKIVEQYINNHILPYYNNTHSNAYCGRMMSHYIYLAKDKIKKAVNARPEDQIIFTGNGCSGAVNHLIHCLDLLNHTPEDTVVFISKAEHHSNHLPWTHLPVTLIYVPLLNTGIFDLQFLERELIKYQRYPNIIASFIATSNVTGVHQPTHLISQLIHKYGGLSFWDFAASSPYLPINVHYNDQYGQYYDAIFISTHKFFGGPGAPGILIAHKNLFKNEVPYCPAGGTVRFACPRYQSYSQDIETKETGGTPNIIGSIKAGLVFDFKNRYQSYIEYWDQSMTPYIQSRLTKFTNIKILNPLGNLNRQPIFAFMIDQLHYNLIVVLLNDLFGIQSRGGISCCSLLAQDLLGIDQSQQKKIHDQIVTDHGMPPDYGWCRVSFHYSMPKMIVDYVIDAIGYVAKYGIQFKRLYKYYPSKNTWLHCPNNCPWNDFSQLKLSLDDYDKITPFKYLDQTILNKQMSDAMSVVAKIKFI